MTPLVRSEVGVPQRLKTTRLALQAGSLTALIGPNGSGKTSLLRALAGIEGAEGNVEIGGELVTAASPARRRALLSFLPASRDVIWPIRVRDVIGLGQSTPDPARVQELLAMFELVPLADRAIDTLSTGERARVLLARALAAKPRLLLLDEPLSNLDPYWVARTLAVIREAAAEGASALVSLHELSLLKQFDRAVLIHNGQLIADGLPKAVSHDPAFERAFRVRQANGGWQIR